MCIFAPFAKQGKKMLEGKQNPTIAYLRSFRVLKIALFDVIVTILGALLVVFLLNRTMNFKIKYRDGVIGMFLLGIIVHRLFDIPTTVDKFLFGENIC